MLPKDLMYSKSHEWIKFTNETTALVGLTDHAQQQLSDVVFVNLCDEDETFTTDDVIGDIESIKAVSEMLAPVDGTVVKINEDVLDSPEMINTSPYEAWLVEFADITDKSQLLSPEEYQDLIDNE